MQKKARRLELNAVPLVLHCMLLYCASITKYEVMPPRFTSSNTD